MIEEDDQTMSSLPANRAFIIQFRPAATDGATRFEGRVEHLASGHAKYFSSQAELLKIVDDLLLTAHRQS